MTSLFVACLGACVIPALIAAAPVQKGRPAAKSKLATVTLTISGMT